MPFFFGGDTIIINYSTIIVFEASFSFFKIFLLKEVDIGLAADVGTLQRLPKILGNDRLFTFIFKKKKRKTQLIGRQNPQSILHFFEIFIQNRNEKEF